MAEAVVDRPLDELEQFFLWFMRNASVLAFVPVKQPIRYIEGVTSVCLYRCAPFQVEMFIAPPHCIVPEHTHPNVDSIEVPVGGGIHFSLHGKYVAGEDAVKEDGGPLGTLLNRGKWTRVRPDSVHGGWADENGGVFLSVQHWLNGVKPHSVALDYSGAVMGPNHLSQVQYGEAVLKEQLSRADCASSEPTL